MIRTIVLAAAALAAAAGGFLYFQASRSRTIPVDLGVPVYPSARFQDNLTVAGKRIVLLETDDPPRAVVAFYRGRLEGRVRVLETSSGAVLYVESGGINRVLTVAAGRDGGATQIAVAYEDRR